MRSMLLVLALSAPAFVFAAPTYTNAIGNVPSAARAVKPQRVTVAFFNSTLSECRVRVGASSYNVPFFQQVKIDMPVGSTVTIDSTTNSKIARTLQASAADAGRQVVIQQQ